MTSKKIGTRSPAKKAKASSSAAPGALSADHDKWVAQLATNQPEFARSLDPLCRELAALTDLVLSLPDTIGSRFERNEQQQNAELAGRSWDFKEVFGGQTAFAKLDGLAAPQRPSENSPAARTTMPAVSRSSSAPKVD